MLPSCCAAPVDAEVSEPRAAAAAEEGEEEEEEEEEEEDEDEDAEGGDLATDADWARRRD